MKISFAIVLPILLLVLSCGTKKQTDKEDILAIKIGRKDSLRSNILNENRPYWVYVPPYTQGSGETFSVLYLLDGDAHFHSVSGLLQIMGTGVNGTRKLPEMIVVAIPNIDRTKDLTPTHTDSIDGEPKEFLKTSGGGVNFLNFIKDELIPHIDSRYPTNPYRVFVGHSFGGIAVINALYMIPETFDAYVAIDPSLWWDDHLLLNLAPKLLPDQRLNGKYFYLSQANTLGPGETTNDHFGSIKEYARVLETSNTSLKWLFKYYPDDNHGSVPFISTYDGLRFIYEDYNPTYEAVAQNLDLINQLLARYKSPVPERRVNGFGHRALQEKNFDLAFTCFQINLNMFPKSSDAFDSMGEYWMTKGDTAKALDNYKKSVAVNPGGSIAQQMIDSIRQKKALPSSSK